MTVILSVLLRCNKNEAGNAAFPTETELTATEIIERLGLAPHPEGGWYRETLRRPAAGGGTR